MWLKMWGVSVQREAVQRPLHPLADDIGPQNSTKTSSHLTNIYQMLLPVRQVLGSTMDKINRCPPQGAPHPMLQVARGEEPQSRGPRSRHRADLPGSGMGQGGFPNECRGRRDPQWLGEVFQAERAAGGRPLGRRHINQPQK